MRGLYKNGVLRVFRNARFTSIRYFVQETACMSKRDSYKLNYMLKQCQGSIECIKKMHAKIIIEGYGQNPFVGSKLLSMYSELGHLNMKDARKVFDNLSERDVFLWNMMIQGYANSGLLVEALNMYNVMHQCGVVVNKYTFTFVLKASGIMTDGTAGRVIHGHVLKYGFETDLFVGNAVIACYAKYREIEASRRAFEEIPQKDLVSWNSIISGYTNNGHVDEALVLFRDLLDDKSLNGPDHATLVSILPACAQAAEIQLGFWIHCYIIKTGLTVDAMLGSGLITMYGNCGRLNCACSIFDQISKKNTVVWTAMMRVYGMHGNAEATLNLFSRFLEHRFCPDGVVFLCLLSTCSHAGMIEKGHEIFKLMEDYGVEKGQEHYACMVDLLGRAGLLMEAVQLMETMPMLPGKDVYGALLGACRIYNNIELAEEVAERLFVLDPNNGGRYATLAKMYEEAGRLEDAAVMRKMMGNNKIKKSFGCSSVEVDSVLLTFGVEDETHPRLIPVFDTLAGLERVMDEDVVDDLIGFHFFRSRNAVMPWCTLY